MVNCPLSKLKVSVISLVLPGFGVLYRFEDGSVDNFRYTKFIQDCIHFIRKTICNNKTEIVLIEDDCPIHSTLHVEEAIDKLKISLIPIVPYSPSLNSVVEGLFGLIKSSNIRVIGENGNDMIREEIKFIWRELINNNFNLDIAHSLYYEWILRMEECKEGEPIYSGHIHLDGKDKFNFDRLQNITVDRSSQPNK